MDCYATHGKGTHLIAIVILGGGCHGEVTLFIEQIHGSAPHPTNYGSTLTE